MKHAILVFIINYAIPTYYFTGTGIFLHFKSKIIEMKPTLATCLMFYITKTIHFSIFLQKEASGL